MDYRGDGPGLIALFRASRGQAAGRPGAVAAGGASGTGGGPDSRISREDPGLREDRGDSRAPKAPGSPDPPRHLSGPRSRRERGAHEALFARARERAPEHTAHAGDPRRPDRRAYGGALPVSVSGPLISTDVPDAVASSRRTACGIACPAKTASASASAALTRTVTSTAITTSQCAPARRAPEEWVFPERIKPYARALAQRCQPPRSLREAGSPPAWQ
jgi:hypothetical protein